MKIKIFFRQDDSQLIINEDETYFSDRTDFINEMNNEEEKFILLGKAYFNKTEISSFMFIE